MAARCFTPDLPQADNMESKEYAIKDYSLIGNCETAALINPDGGIDWMCLPAFDGPSIFGALLDRGKGGEFYIRPAIPFRSERSYLADTAIFVTRFITDRGTLELKDFFVIAREKGARFYDFTALYPTRKLVRTFTLIAGDEIPIEIAIKARPDYGRKKMNWQQTRHGYILDEAAFYSDLPLEQKGDDVFVSLSLKRGSRHHVVCDYGEENSAPKPAQVESWYQVTESFWKEWNLFNYYRGPYQAMVRRSAVTLKLLTYAPTGAFVAAPTTSLPETFGSEQNWDYRYVWVRDTSLFIDAFFRLGYSGEAQAFFKFMARRCTLEREQFIDKEKRNETSIKVLYGIRPESVTEEKYLDHFTGYRNSKPVRIGNRAADQFQIDNYGHLLQAMYYFKCTGGKFTPHMQELAEDMVRDVLNHWQEKDNGIWEMPAKRNYTYGKQMAWMALRRAVDMELLPNAELDKVSRKIKDQIMQKGIKTADGGPYLSESYESPDVDAAGLLAFTSGLISEDLARTTREQIERHLAVGPFLYRNQEQRHHWKEGAFLLCSFWYVNHLIKEDRLEQAEEALKKIMDRASPFGLFAEEIDPETGEFIGNFPQGFSHLGLIKTILNLEDAKKIPGTLGFRIRKNLAV